MEVIHDIPEEQKTYGCGQALSRIGEETCEKLEIIPAQVRVRRHVRPKYACKACEGSGDEDNPAVRIAPAVKQLVPKSIASRALIAYMLVAKFCDALPLYRQERQFQRMGVDISRQDMANWTIQVYRRIESLVQLLRQQIRSGPVVGICVPLGLLEGRGDQALLSAKTQLHVLHHGIIIRETDLAYMMFREKRALPAPIMAMRPCMTSSYQHASQSGRAPRLRPEVRSGMLYKRAIQTLR